MGGDNIQSANTAGKKPPSGPDKKTPGEWLKIHKGKSYWLAGLLKSAGWKDDELVTEAEFGRKLDTWLKRPHDAQGRSK